MADRLPGRGFESLPEPFFPPFVSRLYSLLNDLDQVSSDCQVWSMSKIKVCASCFMLAPTPTPTQLSTIIGLG